MEAQSESLMVNLCVLLYIQKYYLESRYVESRLC